MIYFVVVSLLLIGVLCYAWIRCIKLGPVYKGNIHISGKTVLITGGNRGLGKAVATELARRRARVVIASRNVQLGIHAVSEIKSATSNKHVVYMRLDLADLNDVRRFVRLFLSRQSRLDILINNAGCISSEMTNDERHGLMFTANLLGPFLLTKLLLPLLQKTGSPKRQTRIINVTCAAFMLSDIILNDIDPYPSVGDPLGLLMQYLHTKLMIIHVTMELSKQLRQSGVAVYAVHPGFVNSTLGLGLGEESSNSNIAFQMARIACLMFMKLFKPIASKSPYYCAQPVLFCSLNPGIERFNGSYFNQMKNAEMVLDAKNRKIARKIWKELEEMSAKSSRSRKKKSA